MVFAAIQVQPIKYVSAEAEMRGVFYGSNAYYDVIGRAKIKPIKHLFVAGGYRYEKIKVDTSGFKANAEFKGPFAEAGVEF